MRPPPERLETPGRPNPVRAESHWPAVVIAGGYQTGVVAMRDLSRRGLRVSCVESINRPNYPAFRTRYGQAYACPDPDEQPDEWMRFMESLGRRLGGRPVLMASADQFVSAIARHAAALEPCFTISPASRLEGELTDKASQYGLAERHGMPTPWTRVVSSAPEAWLVAAEVRYPCLLKPRSARAWQSLPRGHRLCDRKVAVASTPVELVDLWNLAAAIDPVVTVQEIVQGPDTDKRVYFACYDRGGRRVAHVVLRELRCSPPGLGSPTMTAPVTDRETETLCDVFLRRVRYSGICEIETKRDSRDGTIKLIEVNPRLTGSGDAAPYAGVDISWLHYLDLIGERVTPVEPLSSDFRHVVLGSEINSVAANRQAGLTSWGAVVHSYSAPLAFYDFDLHDWRNALSTVGAVARAALGRVVRSLFSRHSRALPINRSEEWRALFGAPASAQP